jgi:N-acetylmuramoyl-L-alanine amidase
MGRIFLSAGHGGFENGVRDPGTVAAGVVEADEMIKIRDLVVSKLRSRNIEVFVVPDYLSQVQSIDWINARAGSDDVALEIQASGSPNPSTRGARVFYIALNSSRKEDAQQLLNALLREVPQLPNAGVKPDTETGLGSLVFCRWIAIASLFMEIAYLTNPDDRFIIQNRRNEIATGIANGLAAWVGAGTVPPPPPPPPSNTYLPINININGQSYGEQGLLINGNSYIPIDLVDLLGIDLSKFTQVRRLAYRNIVYVKAVELRDFNISVGWYNPDRAVVLRSNLQICRGEVDKIMSNGSTSEGQLEAFLRERNSTALTTFPEIAKLYRQEATIEGVNYDIAFAQMCVETNFLRFGGEVNSNQNNFGGLGSVGGAGTTASFPSARIGVRAHIQHLKAYASREPVVQEIVDPRFRFITRGIAPLVSQLGGRWSADLQYGDRILAQVRLLYEKSGLLAG